MYQKDFSERLLKYMSSAYFVVHFQWVVLPGGEMGAARDY